MKYVETDRQRERRTERETERDCVELQLPNNIMPKIYNLVYI